MTVKECRKRKRQYEGMLSKMQLEDYEFSKEEFELLKLAVMRSIACEILNIEELKRELPHDLEV